MRLLLAIACAISVSSAFAATGVLHDWDPAKGSGYIAPDGDGAQKVPVSSAGVLPADRKLLKPGALVSYDMADKEANPHAKNVHVTGAGTPPTTDVLGKVKWFSDAKGYGFITPTGGGEDIFVHFAQIKMQGLQSLREGQSVRYDVMPGPKGAQAMNVRPIK